LHSLIFRPSVALLTFATGLLLTWLCGWAFHSSTAVTKASSPPPVALVNRLGERLAHWSQMHGKNILIDGKAINYVSRCWWVIASSPGKPGCGTPGLEYSIGWDSLGSDSQPSPEWENLRDSLVRGKCDEKSLTDLIEAIPATGFHRDWWPTEMLADALRCLGEVSFEPVKGPASPRLNLP
jgi:hypothetical protein